MFFFFFFLFLLLLLFLVGFIDFLAEERCHRVNVWSFCRIIIPALLDYLTIVGELAELFYLWPL